MAGWLVTCCDSLRDRLELNRGGDSPGLKGEWISKMLPLSTLPEAPVRHEGLCSLLPDGRSSQCSILFIVAHPGDEIVAAGGALTDLPDARFLHVTNGAARDLATAMEDGFFDRQEYADARKREFFAALR